MKPTRIFALGMFTALMMVVIAVAAFQVGTAFAATGSCYPETYGHIFEAAICWLKANGIVGGTVFNPNASATRATVAQWLYKQSQIPPTQGVILISAGNTAWQKAYFFEDTRFEHFPNGTYLSKLATGDGNLFLEPTIPLTLYGRQLQLLGVEFCYTASPSVQLDYVEVRILRSSDGSGQSDQKFSDSTVRTDTACRYYVLSTPHNLTAEDSLVFRINVHWTDITFEFTIVRTTFVLKPTAIKVTPPSADSPEAVILTESTGGKTAP